MKHPVLSEADEQSSAAGQEREHACQAAVRAFRASLPDDSSPSSREYAAGRAWEVAGLPEEALACFRRSLEIATDSPSDSSLNAILRCARATQSEAAVAEWLAESGNLPASANQVFVTGLLWKLSGEIERAEKTFLLAGERAVDQSNAYRAFNEVVHSLVARGQTEEAERVCRHAKQECPDYSHLLAISLTGILRVAGRLEEALHIIEGVVETFPGLGDAHANRAVLLYAMGRRNDAENAVARTIELAPNLVATLRQLGHLPEDGP